MFKPQVLSRTHTNINRKLKVMSKLFFTDVCLLVLVVIRQKLWKSNAMSKIIWERWFVLPQSHREAKVLLVRWHLTVKKRAENMAQVPQCSACMILLLLCTVPLISVLTLLLLLLISPLLAGLTLSILLFVIVVISCCWCYLILLFYIVKWV